MEAACGLSLGSLNSINSINRLGLSTPETRNEIFLLSDCTTLPCVVGLRSARYSKCIICNMILHVSRQSSARPIHVVHALGLG